MTSESLKKQKMTLEWITQFTLYLVLLLILLDFYSFAANINGKWDFGSIKEKKLKNVQFLKIHSPQFNCRMSYWSEYLYSILRGNVGQIVWKLPNESKWSSRNSMRMLINKRSGHSIKTIKIFIFYPMRFNHTVGIVYKKKSREYIYIYIHELI